MGTTLSVKHEQINDPHLPERRTERYTKSPTVQDTVQCTPGLISFTIVPGDGGARRAGTC